MTLPNNSHTHAKWLFLSFKKEWEIPFFWNFSTSLSGQLRRSPGKGAVMWVEHFLSEMIWSTAFPSRKSMTNSQPKNSCWWFSHQSQYRRCSCDKVRVTVTTRGDYRLPHPSVFHPCLLSIHWNNQSTALMEFLFCVAFWSPGSMATEGLKWVHKK